jgi:hypothetical protein
MAARPLLTQPLAVPRPGRPGARLSRRRRTPPRVSGPAPPGARPRLFQGRTLSSHGALLQEQRRPGRCHHPTAPPGTTLRRLLVSPPCVSGCGAVRGTCWWRPNKARWRRRSSRNPPILRHTLIRTSWYASSASSAPKTRRAIPRTRPERTSVSLEKAATSPPKAGVASCSSRPLVRSSCTQASEAVPGRRGGEGRLAGGNKAVGRFAPEAWCSPRGSGRARPKG